MGTGQLPKPELLGWMSWLLCLLGPTLGVQASQPSQPLLWGAAPLKAAPTPSCPSQLRVSHPTSAAGHGIPSQSPRPDPEEEENRRVASGILRARPDVQLRGSPATAAECPLCQAALGHVKERGFS